MTTTTQPVELSSGGQYSGHADFINTWDQTVLATLVTKCLNAYRHCGARLASSTSRRSARASASARCAAGATVAVGLIVPERERIGHHRAEREVGTADRGAERACERRRPSRAASARCSAVDQDAQRRDRRPAVDPGRELLERSAGDRGLRSSAAAPGEERDSGERYDRPDGDRAGPDECVVAVVEVLGAVVQVREVRAATHRLVGDARTAPGGACRPGWSPSSRRRSGRGRPGRAARRRRAGRCGCRAGTASRGSCTPGRGR